MQAQLRQCGSNGLTIALLPSGCCTSIEHFASESSTITPTISKLTAGDSSARVAPELQPGSRPTNDAKTRHAKGRN